MTRMPAIFLAHGNPMNALTVNPYTQAWAAIGQLLPRPKAILAISAHWYIPETAVTANDFPPTIHDFGGFPQALFDVQYPAPGSRELARHVQQLLSPTAVGLDESWGLDHGTWSLLCHVFPETNVPVIQLSLDKTQPPPFHYGLGKRLQPLRDEGVLILGSGNIVHNLATYNWGNPAVQPYDWAKRFEENIKNLITQGQDDALIDYAALGADALLSVPTPEHYLPLLVVLGLRDKSDEISFPVQGMEGGSISMLSVAVGI